MQHAKFAMLDKMLDLFKRPSFTQHFVKEEKIQKYLLDLSKVVIQPTNFGLLSNI